MYGVIREQLVNFLMGFGKAIVQPMHHKNNGAVRQLSKRNLKHTVFHCENRLIFSGVQRKLLNL